MSSIIHKLLAVVFAAGTGVVDFVGKQPPGVKEVATSGAAVVITWLIHQVETTTRTGTSAGVVKLTQWVVTKLQELEARITKLTPAPPPPIAVPAPVPPPPPVSVPA